MRDIRCVPAQSRQALASILLRCPLHRTDRDSTASLDGLAASDSIILRRLLAELRVSQNVRPTKVSAGAGQLASHVLCNESVQHTMRPQRVSMSASLAKAAAAANAVSKGGSMTGATRIPRTLTDEERDRAWSLEENIRKRSGPVGITVVQPDRMPAAISDAPPVAPRRAW